MGEGRRGLILSHGIYREASIHTLCGLDSGATFLSLLSPFDVQTSLQPTILGYGWHTSPTVGIWTASSTCYSLLRYHLTSHCVPIFFVDVFSWNMVFQNNPTSCLRDVKPLEEWEWFTTTGGTPVTFIWRETSSGHRVTAECDGGIEAV